MSTAIAAYLTEINNTYLSGNATEHTYRPALKNFIEAIGKNVVATNEPKRIACGAPDFIVEKNCFAIGFIECKNIGESLDTAERSEQLTRYLTSIDNLILTDYLEFRYYYRGNKKSSVILAKKSNSGKIIPNKKSTASFALLANTFFSAEVTPIKTVSELVGYMANIAKMILSSILISLQQNQNANTIHSQFEAFKTTLLKELTQEQFADMYAQTICYGMFSAWVNHPQNSETPFSRIVAAHDIPKTNPFLRQMFDYIAGVNLDDSLSWVVNLLADLFRNCDKEGILNHFGKGNKQEDPVIHLYESFLAQYNPEMRKGRGVYYTPPSIVDYIVRSIDFLLKQDFDCTNGLAEHSKISIKRSKKEPDLEMHKVQILDPACGTGTFLHNVIKHINDGFSDNKGAWCGSDGYVAQHLLPRVFGFEILMAPYSVSHMKLGWLLKETGYDFPDNRRLHVYLTNTLEKLDNMYGGLFENMIAKESRGAQEAKQNTPVMVILGNPPYSAFSQNKGEWIEGLVADYKQGLDERKVNLNEDFVKFIRFSQWRIETTGYGIVAIITGNTFLNGSSHRTMRRILLEKFDDIYILNLFGATRGDGEENVFDVQQGVSINIFVRKQHKQKRKTKLLYAGVHGTRKDKYSYLSSNTVSSTKWDILEPISPKYLFVPQEKNTILYESSMALNNIFNVYLSGVQTKRDRLFVSFTREELEKRFELLLSSDNKSKIIEDDYEINSTKNSKMYNSLMNSKYNASLIKKILYRAFDERYIYYDKNLLGRARYDIMQHMIADSENIGLVFNRQIAGTSISHFGVSEHMICHGTFFLGNRGQDYLAPLYLHSELDATKYHNISNKFIVLCEKETDLRFDEHCSREKTFTPLDILGYIYAIVYSPSYRQIYEDELRLDFPHIPIFGHLFKQLSEMGKELILLHTFKKKLKNTISFPISGNNIIVNVRYVSNTNDAFGKVFINKEQYFDGVERKVYEFMGGGYQICEKWLKVRKGRSLSFDDIDYYVRLYEVLSETCQAMNEIDAIVGENIS